MADGPPAQQPPAKHDIMAAKKAIQDDDGHFNFWRADEMRDGNAEVKVQNSDWLWPSFEGKHRNFTADSPPWLLLQLARR